MTSKIKEFRELKFENSRRANNLFKPSQLTNKFKLKS